MAINPRIAVIGAGIVGLSTAVALQDAGATVRIFEKNEPGQAQSVGLARIFRASHQHPKLVQLAMRARDAWEVWEQRFGRQLLGREGLLVTGDELIHAYAQALRSAGAPYRHLDAAEAHDLIPLGHFPQSTTLLDPSGGSIRARRTVEVLRAAVTDRLVHGEVREIVNQASGVRVTTETGSWDCDRVLIAAGLDTPALAAQVGLEIPGEPWQIIRFTYNRRGHIDGQSAACWIDVSMAYGDGLSAYCQPIGTTGRYAVGVSRSSDGYTSLDVPREVMRRRALERSHVYVSAALPGLDPKPVDEVWCAGTMVDYPEEDGFRTYRLGSVLALYGTNLFKFAPLLGELCADAVLHDESPPELRATYLL
jgi:sarcosine oxidase